MDTTASRDLIERVTRLERQNTFFKLLLTIILPLGAVLILAAAGQKSGTVIDAGEFRLVDDDGNLLAAWRNEEEGMGPFISFFDETGATRTQLGFSDDPGIGSVLFLLFGDHNTEEGILLIAGEEVLVALGRDLGTIVLAATEDGPGILLTTEAGTVWESPASPISFRMEQDREAAYVAAMKTDLFNLFTRQESYFADYLTYTSRLPSGYSTSAGVTVQILTASATGWNALASHEASTVTCSIYEGTATPLPPATPRTPMGEVVCSE